MDKFLKKYKVPKLTQGEIEILNSPLLKENEFATKNVFIIKLQAQKFLLVKHIKYQRKKIPSLYTFKKQRIKGTLLILRASIIFIPNPDIDIAERKRKKERGGGREGGRGRGREEGREEERDRARRKEGNYRPVSLTKIQTQKFLMRCQPIESNNILKGLRRFIPGVQAVLTL